MHRILPEALFPWRNQGETLFTTKWSPDKDCAIQTRPSDLKGWILYQTGNQAHRSNQRIESKHINTTCQLTSYSKVNSGTIYFSTHPPLLLSHPFKPHHPHLAGYHKKWSGAFEIFAQTNTWNLLFSFIYDIYVVSYFLLCVIRLCYSIISSHFIWPKYLS